MLYRFVLLLATVFKAAQSSFPEVKGSDTDVNVLEVCNLETSSKYEFVSFWVKIQLTVNITQFYYQLNDTVTGVPSTFFVPKIGVYSTPTGLSDQYYIPADGVFMWFGLVLQWDNSIEKCRLVTMAHWLPTLPLIGGTTALPGYRQTNQVVDVYASHSQFNVSNGGQIRFNKNYELKQPQNYSAGARLLVHKVVFDRDDITFNTVLNDLKFLELWMNGRNNAIYKRMSLMSFFDGEQLEGLNVGGQPLTASRIIQKRIEGTYELGFKVQNEMIDGTWDFCANCGLMVTLNIYNIDHLKDYQDKVKVNLVMEYYDSVGSLIASSMLELHLEFDVNTGNIIAMVNRNFDVTGGISLSTGPSTITTSLSYSDFSTNDKVIVLDIGSSLMIPRHVDSLLDSQVVKQMSYFMLRNSTSTLEEDTESMKRFTWFDSYLRTFPVGSNPLASIYSVRLEMEPTFQNDLTMEDIRLYRIEHFYGFKDYSVYPGPLLDPADLANYNEGCYLPMQEAIATDDERDHHYCEDFYPIDRDDWGHAPNCAYYLNWDDRRCNYCDPGYFPDIVDTFYFPPQYSCHTKDSCDASPGYLYVTTDTLEQTIGGLSTDDHSTAKQKPLCITCPPNCKTCTFDEITPAVVCSECLNASVSTLGLNGCTCTEDYCSICNTTSCDICNYDHMLYIHSDGTRNCQPGLDDCNLGYGYNKTYFTGLYEEYKDWWGWRVCQHCSEHCVDCSDNVAQCVECSNSPIPYYVANLSFAVEEDYRNTSECFLATDTIKGMVFDSTNMQFLACTDNCRVCGYNASSSTTYCIQCVTDYAVHDTDQTCILNTSCTFANRKRLYTIVEGSLTVDRCTDFPAHCVNSTANHTCEQCEPYYSLQPPLSAESCLLCGRGCLECSNFTNCFACLNSSNNFNPENNSCMDCGPNTNSFVDLPGNYCVNCFTRCHVCQSTSHCLQCLDPYYLSSDSTQCLYSCPAEQIPYNHTNGTLACIGCPPNCQNCTFVGPTSPSICTTCNPDYSFDPDNNCVDCSASGRLLVNSVCLTCPANCSKCENGIDTCTECNYGKYLIPSNGSLCGDCHAPHFPATNWICVECLASNCLQCTSIGSQCQICRQGYELQLNGTCQERNYLALSAHYKKNDMAIQVKFSRPLQSISSQNVQLLALDESSDLGNFTLALTSVNKTVDSNTWLFTFTTDKSVQKATLSLHFFDRFAMMTSDEPYALLNPANQTILIKNAQINFPQVNSAVSTAGATTATILIILAAVVSFNSAVIMFKIYQMMDFMLLYNVTSPANFMTFISIFQTMDPTSMVPDLLQTVYDEECSLLGDKFESQEMGCQFFSNCSTTLTFFMAHFAGSILIRIILWPFRKKENKVLKWLRSLKDGALGYKGFFSLITMFDMDIMIAAATNSKYYAGDKIRTFNNIGNNLIAATVVYFYPVLIIFIAYRTAQVLSHKEGIEEMPEKKFKIWEYMADDRKTVTWFQRYYEPVSLFRNYLICVSVVGFYDSPLAQMIVCTLLLVASFILTVKHRPFDTRLENISSGLAWFCYSICSLLFIVVHVSNPLMSYDQANMMLGWPLIVAFSALVASNMIPPLIAVVISAVQALKSKFCKKKTDKTEGEGEASKENIQKVDESIEKLNKPSPRKKPEEGLKIPPITRPSDLPRRRVPLTNKKNLNDLKRKQFERAKEAGQESQEGPKEKRLRRNPLRLRKLPDEDLKLD